MAGTAHDHDERDFDARAATWDQDPTKVERAARAADAIREVVPLSPTSRVLDYGAGTGLLGQHLEPHVGPITMADPSQGMRAVIQEKAKRLGLDDLTVVDLDLARDPLPDERYDLVATLMALHHVEDPPPVLAAMARLLLPGGWLAVIDLEAEDGSFHQDGFEGQHGFDRATLTAWLTDAGFVDVEFRPCGEVDKQGQAYPLFLATAHVPD